jgi:RsiW-degrading membrane proteinase PrsW (M82 family)
VDTTALGYAFLGGILPALLWLYFLLKEDASHPEPKKLIAFAFLTGMIAVCISIPLEKNICSLLSAPHACGTTQKNYSAIVVGWVLIEEVAKYAMAAIFLFWRKAVDEKSDYIIYMITVALGFAALENTFFILDYLMQGDMLNSFLVGNTRFLGSTLLHVVASAAIGFSLALSARSNGAVRVFSAAGGLILAVALHTAFNMLMMSEGTSITLFLVWMIVVVFFAAFEVLKYFQYRNFPNPIRPS